MEPVPMNAAQRNDIGNPWGLELKGLGYQYGGIKANNYLYNGMEYVEDLNLNIYSAFYRNYDPVIGRWWQIDPKNSEKESPYVGMGNNPILYSDYLGDTIVVGNLTWIDKALSMIGYDTDEMVYVKKVKFDIDQLKKDDSEVAGMIRKLEESEFTHKIEKPKNDGKGNRVTFNEEKADKGERQGTIVGYDPDGKRSVSGEKRSPRVGLAHELRHSHDSDIEVVSTVPSVNGIPSREINAVNTENKIRKVTGDPKKTTYGNRKIPSSHLD
jgi:RHS repeat-associated protein